MVIETIFIDAMGRPSNPVPSYTCSHHGYGRIYWRGQYRLLPGKFGSEESLSEFRRLCEIVAVTGELPPAKLLQTETTVAEMCEAFLAAMRKKYPPTSAEPKHLAYGVSHIRKMFGPRPANSIRPTDLEVLRASMVRTLCRKTVNRRITQTVRAFRWAVTRELVDAGTYAALSAVEPIKPGMDGATDYPPVMPVDDDHFEAVMAESGFRLRCMLIVHRATGMRSGELVAMTPEDVDMSQGDWLYFPARHKTQGRGKDRIVGIPRSVTPILLDTMPDRHLPWFPIQVNTYRNNVRAACDRAKVPRFHPHQLRHSLATKVKTICGEEAAATLLSVSNDKTAKVYARVTPESVRRIMREVRDSEKTTGDSR
jgi:integrase